MWNQTPLLEHRAASLPDRSGDGLRTAIRDVIGSEPVYVRVYRPDVVSQAVSFWRAVQTPVWRGRPDPDRDSRAAYHAGAVAHVVSMLREKGDEPTEITERQEECWRSWFADEEVAPIDVPYPVLWRNLTSIVASVLEALGQDPRLAPEPVRERQANGRSDEWVNRYHIDAKELGLPV